MIEALDGIEEGVPVGGVLQKDIKFADDRAMVASSEDGLQKMMDSLDVTGRRYDMKINVKKTKTMRISRRGGVKLHIEMYGNTVEQVKKFRYLGALVTEDGRCEAEIKARVAMAKRFSIIKESCMLTQRMDRKLKKQIIKSVLWSVALYGSETWTMRKKEVERIQAFEMWIWRKMEKISWRDRMSNEVLRLVKEKRSIMNIITERKKGGLVTF